MGRGKADPASQGRVAAQETKAANMALGLLACRTVSVGSYYSSPSKSCRGADYRTVQSLNYILLTISN